jgi:dTDP-4-dehydrorhamnose reductase
VIAADLTQPGQIERVLETSQPDLIINCAAQAEVDRCENYPEEAYQVNTRMPEMLARAAARNGVRLLHISTDAVFDGLRGDYTEEDIPIPINTYARTKLEAERLVSDAHPDVLIARMNFYGWSWHGQRSLAEYFFNHLAAGTPVPGFTDLVFCPLLVNDLVEILWQMLDRHLTGIYHVVSPEALSKYSFGRMVARNFGFNEALVVPASYKTSGLKAPRSPLLTLRSEKLAQAMPKQALSTQEQAMHRFLELYHQGYPRALRSVLVKPADTPRRNGAEIT